MGGGIQLPYMENEISCWAHYYNHYYNNIHFFTQKPTKGPSTKQISCWNRKLSLFWLPMQSTGQERLLKEMKLLPASNHCSWRTWDSSSVNSSFKAKRIGIISQLGKPKHSRMRGCAFVPSPGIQNQHPACWVPLHLKAQVSSSDKYIRLAAVSPRLLPIDINFQGNGTSWMFLER